MARRRTRRAAGADSGKLCKDCDPAGRRRPTPHPGPRCATHHRVVTRDRSNKAKAARVERVYSISEEQYWAIYEAQGGMCAGCQRAKGQNRDGSNGIKKRLSVDHDHACCPGPISCGKCVRGLLCKPCNRDVLGHLRDEIAAFRRFIDYLEHPPARRVLFRPRG